MTIVSLSRGRLLRLDPLTNTCGSQQGFTLVGDTADVERELMIELRLVTSSLSAASLTNLHIGEYVTLRDRWFYVRGVSSKTAASCRVQLEDMDTGERLEASSDEIEPTPRWRRSADTRV